MLCSTHYHRSNILSNKRNFASAVTVTNLEDINTSNLPTHFPSLNDAQFEHGGGAPLVQVTHDAGGTLSNEEYSLREVSLCRGFFTVVWRYWITFVGGLSCGLELIVDFFWLLYWVWTSKGYGCCWYSFCYFFSRLWLSEFFGGVC
jgi:hypothetical protein